ncbi:LysR substrate-binding domain-containing protein [Aeromonas jandaei]|uniref:LysR substrate-binding domain-containing protein n=1 Tax=Aeromonas jandaei TaxID=650 RepID=UPI00191D695E|nr:LysR substrate-binding domain-containing protein [Aeromonas jandaei]MBL0628360.1 LysR family transcriptional regulator [Aeromonas jandaei]
MKLQQLRYIVEVANHGLNLSATAESLYTSQPGISKQVRMLEDELGIQIFERSGKHLTRITPIGQEVIKVATDVLEKVATIKTMARAHIHPEQGQLTVAATHLQARYILPDLIKGFVARFPKVTLTLMQGDAATCCSALQSGSAHLMLLDDIEEHHDEGLLILPSFRWQRGLVVPACHPVAARSPSSLADLGNVPLISDGRSLALTSAHHEDHRIACLARDSDVLKTYVRQGMGFGIMAMLARETGRDDDLVMKALPDLPAGMAAIGLRRGAFVPAYLYDFIARLVPTLSHERLDEYLATPNQREWQALLATLPER